LYEVGARQRIREAGSTPDARADRIGISDEAFLGHLRQGATDVFQGLLDL
jgi:hypothetical protein